MPMEADLMKPAYFMIHESIDNPSHFKDNTLHHSRMHISLPFLSIFYGLSRTFFGIFTFLFINIFTMIAETQFLMMARLPNLTANCLVILDRKSE